jgi:hypothetical protein
MTNTTPYPEDETAREPEASVPQPEPAAPAGPPAGDPYSVPRPSTDYARPSGPGFATPIPPQQGGWAGGTRDANSTNVLAIVSLIASVASFIFLPVIGAIAGIITGHIALRQIKETGEQGRALALWGTIVGYIHIGLGVLGALLFIFLFAIAGAAGINGALQHQGDQTQQCIEGSQASSGYNDCGLTSP